MALAEPINLDLTREIKSKPRGIITYSHNYPYLFTRHNYEIFRQIVDRKEPDPDVTAQITMVAKTFGEGS